MFVPADGFKPIGSPLADLLAEDLEEGGEVVRGPLTSAIRRSALTGAF